jgi:hypothetical protein
MTTFLAGIVTLNVGDAGRLIVVVMSDHADYQGVWAYDVDTGVERRCAALPCLGNHLNGSAIDDAGNMYVATHIGNSVVKVDPGGRVLGEIAGAAEGIIGSTAAIITCDDHGTKWLYVTNDGGLLIPVEGRELLPNVTRLRL